MLNVNILTGSTILNDDVIIPTDLTFIGPLTKEQMVSSNNISTISSDDSNSFTTNAFLDLERKVYGDNWSIPFKRHEVLGRCLLSAIKLALAGTADLDEHCQKFMEILIPDAFQKLQYSHHINNWGVEVQLGIFDMVELLIDLIAARLSYPPVPVQLLETLAVLFDRDSIFQRKHRSKQYDRSLYDKQLGERVLANSPSSSVHNRNEPNGWLCQIINRFVFKDGIQNLKGQFKIEQPLTDFEYNALLGPFVNCMDYILIEKYRQLFSEHMEQALEYVQSLKEEDFQSINSIFELLSTLRKICSVVWVNRLDQIEKLHLNLLLKMVTGSNFNAKMNSLKELSKLIENSTSNIQCIAKASIPHDILSQWIIENSILSKALQGDIDQNEYVDKLRTVMDFIAPRILKEDIETIWKMQHGRSLVAVDHLFTLIVSAAAKFNFEQLNYLFGFINNSWETETIVIQEKLVELLGVIGRECQKDSAARVLEILWDMAHDDRLSRSMLDHVLHCHLRVFSEGHSSNDALKRDYCLKCMSDLQRRQNWHVPAIRHLYDLLRCDSTKIFKREEQDLMSLLINEHDLILALIQSISTCQLDVWNKTDGHVTIDILVDDRFTYEESIKNHLDLLSFLLKKGNLYLILKRSEQLWDTLISNEIASSFDREFDLYWFLTCVEDLNQETQVTLFEKRISKLDPNHLSPKGLACFQLYSERYHLKRQDLSRKSTNSSSVSPVHSTIMTNLNCLIDVHIGDLTTEQTEVIVICSSSRVLRENILKTGGDSLKTSYDIEFKKNSTIPIIVVPTGGQLPSKRIYFLPWKPNSDEALLCQSIRIFVSNAMERAATENCQSIAFPAIGCGQFGCSISLVAQTLVEEVYRQLALHPILVSFVIQPERTDIYDEFQNQISLLQQPSEIKTIFVTVGKGTIEVEKGDVTQQKVDAIIGSSSSNILQEIIMKAAGTEVKTAYETEYKNNPNAILISTSPGQLLCKRIFFLKWQTHTNEEVLRQSAADFIGNAIQNVISYNFTSVAFPATGYGEYGCSLDIVVRTMVKEMKNQLQMRNLPLTVRFVVQPDQQNIYEEFCKQLLTSKEDPATSTIYQLPSTWQQTTENKIRFLVPKNTDEYISIFTDFDRAMKGKYTQIIQLERIQNERWYMQYLAHSRDFNKRLNTNTEKRLYHGCPQHAANLIIEDCFNRSLAGLNGTSYGFGVYFSSSATYSHSYAKPNANGEQCMFVSRVLIGRTTKGNSSMKTRPVGYDSTTDGNHIFVTYHDAQAFAEYLITYK